MVCILPTGRKDLSNAEIVRIPISRVKKLENLVFPFQISNISPNKKSKAFLSGGMEGPF